MIYYDNSATTKPSETAIKKAEKFNGEAFFNPSALYDGGISASREIRRAKETILSRIGGVNHELIFTSCGSESDNMAIFCAVKRGVFLTDKGEHSAVYKSFIELKNRGREVVFIDLLPDGSVDETKLFDYVMNNPVDFISIVHVNNETGAVNDVNRIAETVKKINPKIIFHSDGVQAFGKIPFRLSDKIDLYSISAHKINGLKGVGALIRKKNVNLSPLIFGGGQENGLRSGTENVFGIKVFEYATEERYNGLTDNLAKITEINRIFRDGLDKRFFRIISGENACPFVLSVSAQGVRGEVLMHDLETQGIIVGNGSACSSKARFSRVISACGYNETTLDGMIRLSFSPENSVEEAKRALPVINERAERLIQMMR